MAHLEAHKDGPGGGCTRHALLTATAATAVMALGFGAMALASVFIAPLEKEFGWSRSEISLGYTVATAGMALGGVFWGRMSVRLPLGRLLAIGSVSMVAALVAMAAAGDLATFYAANFVLGACGFAALYAPMLAATSEWFTVRRGLVTGYVTAGGAAGQGIVPWCAGLMIEAHGWRAAFAATAIATMAVLAILLPWVRKAPGSDNPQPAPEIMTNRGAAPIAGLAVAAFLCCACMGVPLVHMASLVAAICGSAGAGSTSLLVAMLCGAAGRVFFGLIADRIGNLTSYALASAIQTACVVAFPFLEGQAGLLALSAVFGFGFAGNMTCLILCVREAVDAPAFPQVLGFVMLVAWAGMGAGGYGGGFLYDATGNYVLSFEAAFLAGLLNLAAIAWVAAARRRRNPPRLAIALRY